MGKRKHVTSKIQQVGLVMRAIGYNGQLKNFHNHMPDEWDEIFWEIEDSIAHAVQDQWSRHRQNLRDVRQTAEIKKLFG